MPHAGVKRMAGKQASHACTLDCLQLSGYVVLCMMCLAQHISATLHSCLHVGYALALCCPHVAGSWCSEIERGGGYCAFMCLVVLFFWTIVVYSACAAYMLPNMGNKLFARVAALSPPPALAMGTENLDCVECAPQAQLPSFLGCLPRSTYIWPVLACVCVCVCEYCPCESIVFGELRYVLCHSWPFGKIGLSIEAQRVASCNDITGAAPS